MTGRQGGRRVDGKARIILAAEELFAVNGIEGVSLRQIAAKAGQSNHHAVQYHFQTRDALVGAIFDFRMLQMEPIRRIMLEAAKAAGELKDARTLMEIIFLPQLLVVDTDGNNHYAAFLAQFLQRSHGEQFGDFGSPLPPVLSEVLRLLRQRLDYLPEQVAQRRLITACFMFLNILSSYSARGLSEGDDHDLQGALDDTLEQMVCATCSAYRASPSRLKLPKSPGIRTLADVIQTAVSAPQPGADGAPKSLSIRAGRTTAAKASGGS